MAWGMTPQPSIRTRRALPRPRLLFALVAASLVAGSFAVPVAAAWLEARAGSWVVIEAWRHGLGNEPVRRVTTTLLGIEEGRPWFEHQDERGRRWEDADPGTGAIPAVAAADTGRDVPLTTQELYVDGVPVRCRVLVRETPITGWADPEPGVVHLARTKRWVAVDSLFRPRVLKLADMGIRTRYRDGRIETSPATFTEQVSSLHQRVRVSGTDYDCWVSVRKTLTADGGFADRTTTWHHDAPPTGWVRRLVERRDPRDGAMTREEQRLVDYRLR